MTKINPILIGVLIGVVVLAIIVIILKQNALVSIEPDKEPPPPQSAITPTPSDYIKFSYDIAKAEKLLADYITNTIKEEFIPSNVEVKQSLLATGEIRGEGYQFGANWTTDGVIFNAALHYIKNTNDLKDAEVFITPENIQNIPIDSTNSSALTKTYLKNVPETVDFVCGVFNENIEFCEFFKADYLGKSGFGVVRGRDDSGNDIPFIFSCFFPKNDSYYNLRTSCLLYRENNPREL